MKAKDPMDEPCEMGFKFRLPSGEFHTFVLKCGSSHEFMRFTHTAIDRAAITNAFARGEEFPSATISAQILVESSRRARLEYLKKQK